MLSQDKTWKSNVKAMTKQWLDMGLRSRAVTRDFMGNPFTNGWMMSGLENAFMSGLRQCKDILHVLKFGLAKTFFKCHPMGENAWENGGRLMKMESKPRHLYFLGKDNIPFHTVIWPALIMGLNHANDGLISSTPVSLPGPGDLAFETNVPAMEYLMLAGGQFSKSRKHAVWLPSFLERYDPDTLRYYLSINMPENHDTDFNWPDFVEKINSELTAAYGNFVHRILTLGSRLPMNPTMVLMPT